MNPGIAFLVAESVPALGGAGIALLVSTFIHRHHEKRLQWVEHEVAVAHHRLSLPTTPPYEPKTEMVAGRYQELAMRNSQHSRDLADSITKDRTS